MKFYNINRNGLHTLLGEIDKCEGKVELVSEDGSRFDLKKDIALYTKVSNAFAGQTVPELELVAENGKDSSRLFAVMLRNIA